MKNTKVYDVAINTPLQKAEKLSKQTSSTVLLKREDLQPIKSFKIRGAYNKISSLSKKELEKGVIAASAGNHAQGVAISAKKLGIKALIVMPKTTPAIKIEAVKNFGGNIELVGDNYSEAYSHCLKRIEETGMTLIHPFDDEHVIEGQGTIANELLKTNKDITHVFVPVGGGGLLAGIAQKIKMIKPDIKVIGVEPEDSAAMKKSIEKNRIIELEHVGIFADGVAVKKVGDKTFEIVKKYVDEIITVNVDQVCAGIKAIFEDTRSIVEPAGALAVAGLQKYDLPKNSTAVAICSGANMTFERLQLIAERTLIGSGKESLYAIELLEQPGSLLKLCKDAVNDYPITEFNYRLSDKKIAHILVGIGTSNQNEKHDFENSINHHNYNYTDLTKDELAKEHVRYMVGGHGNKHNTEYIYNVLFPERPGALINFLEKLSHKYSISLFHYRNLGSDSGRVLIGFNTDNKKQLESELDKTNYDYIDVTNNTSVRLFT